MNKRSLKAICLCLLCASLSACGLSWVAEPKTNPVLEDRIGLWGKQPVGTLATTAERRVVLVRIAEDDTKTFGKFCAEPPPDAAENIANKMAAAIEAAAKVPEGEASAKMEYAKQLATNVQNLFHRSQGLQFYRDGMFNLCQSYLNNIIDERQFIEKAYTLQSMSYNLIHYELEQTKGIIGGPPPAPPVVLELDDAGLPSAKQRILQSDRVRAHRLVDDLGRAKCLQKDTECKVVLVELHDMLVTKNMDLSNADAAKRTMSDDEIRIVLGRLRPLAIEASQPKLVLPKDLKGVKFEDFQKYFVPSS